MKKHEQYVLFGIIVLIIGIGILSFLYIEKRFSATKIVIEEATPTTTSYIIIHVAGEVKNPGVYKLPVGSRVYEAIEAAGGALKDAILDKLNLARVLKDGEKVNVPKNYNTGQVLSGRKKRIDINEMDKEELKRLPGVGEKLAERIIKYRETHGPFKSIDDLKQVSGIGDKKLEDIKNYLNSQ